MIAAFEQASPVLAKIENAGFEAYFVGGSVRDFLLGKEIDDVDIATSATPLEIKEIFSKTVDVGIEHGTVVVLYGGNSYEVTTFRSELEYEDYRRPSEVNFIRSLKEDLQRRDFTMNAIAMDRRGNIIDPFYGEKAIEAKVIETVGQAHERFQEDALRMMRAVRFVSQLSFTIERSTYEALKYDRALLKHIAIERKTAEFEKLLIGPNLHKAIQILIETKLYEHLPSLGNQQEGLDCFLHQKSFGLTLDETWALFLFSCGIKTEEVEPFLRNWRLPLKKIKKVQNIIYWLDYRKEKEWNNHSLYKAQHNVAISTEKVFNSIRGLEGLSYINELERMYHQLPIKDRKELMVTGSHLIEWFDSSGGPWVKQRLEDIERAILRNELRNQTEEIREWIMKCNQS